ncbi:FCD domain-containing protein [Streptomyces sp. CA-210063]|uniref:FadR/GntR family transcriptional regulator n=1 Tax=Streptomyces sp. CA-210063 TaxID=2801029 RepID=UPI00214C5B64|nr:FCD domain-containing protein [Streptomyces sp. CA-210063]UUU33246.1 FCD domain-containing protein [Streptomyces sp. CA-210063]
MDELGFRISSGALPPGHLVRVEDLEKEFGVSRSVVREAVRVLEFLGLLRSARGVGVTVREDRDWNALDPRVIGWRLAYEKTRATELHALAQLRYAIEPVAAEYMCAASTRRERAELLLCAEEMAAKADDIAAFTAQDVRFHSLILGGTRNHLFTALEPTFTTGLIGRSDYHLMPSTPDEKSIELHLGVAEAIFDGEGGRAAELLRILLKEVVERFAEADGWNAGSAPSDSA